MSRQPVLSIIIATLNSEKLLPSVLQSLNKQSFAKGKMEVLVIDGGSQDSTKKIALQYKAKIIHNPNVIPAWAKYIGYLKAKGKYIMFLDSDEVIVNGDSIERKMAAFMKKEPKVRAVTGSGYMSPLEYPFINQYINDFGDPFSYFIYRFSTDCRFFISMLRKNYTCLFENDSMCVFDYEHADKLPLFELAAMGGIVDVSYMKKKFPEIINKPGLVWHFFRLLISQKEKVAVLKNDPILHYSSNTISRYLAKIESRIITNVFTTSREGFVGRNEFSNGIEKYYKYLFIPYTFTILMPLVDAIHLMYTRKNFGYALHVPLSIYTASLILWYMCLRLFGYRPTLKSYGNV